VCAYVLADTEQTAAATVFEIGRYNGLAWLMLQIRTSAAGDVPRCYVTNAGDTAGAVIAGDTDLRDGNGHWVFLRRSGNNFNLYVDDQAAEGGTGNVTGLGAVAFGATGWYVGLGADASDNPYEGDIAEVRIYHSALTDAHRAAFVAGDATDAAFPGDAYTQWKIIGDDSPELQSGSSSVGSLTVHSAAKSGAAHPLTYAAPATGNPWNAYAQQ
jgi:hypothetical protein